MRCEGIVGRLSHLSLLESPRNVVRKLMRYSVARCGPPDRICGNFSRILQKCFGKGGCRCRPSRTPAVTGGQAGYRNAARRLVLAGVTNVGCGLNSFQVGTLRRLVMREWDGDGRETQAYSCFLVVALSDPISGARVPLSEAGDGRCRAGHRIHCAVDISPTIPLPPVWLHEARLPVVSTFSLTRSVVRCLMESSF